VRNALTRSFSELNDTGDADAAVSSFKQAVEQLQAGVSIGDASLEAVAKEHEAYIKNLPDEAGKPDRLFGLPSLDEVRGPDPGTGELIVIAASPKVGKSALLGNILRESVKQNRPTYFASAEMQSRKTFERLFAAHTGLSSRMVSSPHVLKNNAVKPIYEAGKKDFAAKDIFIEFKSLSVQIVRRMVHYYYHKHGVKLFIFDRLGLFAETQGKDEFAGRRRVTNQLRTLANELPGIKIVLASQITNESLKAKDKRPHVSHVFGGNGSQADATQVFMIYRPYHVDPASDRFKSGPWQGMAAKVPGSSASYAEVYCGLNNNGPSNGSAYLLFDGDRQIFEDVGMNKYVDIASDAIEEELRDIKSGKVGLDIGNLPDLDDEEDDFDPGDIGSETFGVPKMGTGGEPMF
jgi:replicative DNA helicase